MTRKREIEDALQQIRADQQRMLAAQEHDLRRARERIDELEAQLAEERRRVSELADQMSHLIDELGYARQLWHRAEERARGGEA